MSFEYKALAPGGGNSFARRAKKNGAAKKIIVSKSARSATAGLDTGTICLNGKEFEEFERCMSKPAKPTKAIMAGAALLRSLRKKAV